MVKNINLYEYDYNILKDMKLVPSESFNDVINRVLDMKEKGKPILCRKNYDFSKSNLKSIKVSIDTYNRIRLWKKPAESYSLSIHNLLTDDYEMIDIPSIKYELCYHDCKVLFKLVNNDIYYWNNMDEKWENSIIAWIDDKNARLIKNMINFFENFLLKPSAVTLLEDMGDKLVYDDYCIVKLG